MALLIALAGANCTTSQKATADDEETAEHKPRPPRPGSRAWKEAARRLPARSPVVATARLDALLENARGLRAWLVAEPQMFGADGEAFVRRLKSGFNQIATGIGADPLSEEATAQLGIDAGRPLYLGLYPPEATDGVTFVRTFEKTVREQLDLDADQSLDEALEEMRNGQRKIPPGLHSAVAAKLESRQPHAGFRMLVPVADAQTFTDQFGMAASIAEYERIEMPPPGGATASEGETAEHTSTRVQGFINAQSRWPAIALRVDEQWATIDAILPEPGTRPMSFHGEKRRDYLRRELSELIEAGGTGRPRAPRPLDQPAFAISADQRATSLFARMRTYKRALGRASRAAVDRRSVALVEGLSRATAIAGQWSTAADALTGVSYGFYGLPEGQSDRYFRLAMTLYGPTPSADPAIDPVEVGLGVDDRAVGLSMDLAPMFSKAWNDWLAIDELTDLAGDSEVATDHPALYLLSVPRNLALFLVNAERLVEPAIPDSLAPLYERRHDLQRLEVASSGIDVDALRNDPPFVGLLAFDPDAADEDVNVVLQALPALMTLGFESLAPSGDGSEETFEKATATFTENELTAFPLPPSHPAHPFYYYAHTEEQRTFVFFSHGLDENAARREIEEILAGKRSPQRESAFFSRIEPAALTTLLTAFDPNALAPLAPGILAQRLGAFEVSIAPLKRGDVQILQYQLDLEKPPEL